MRRRPSIGLLGPVVLFVAVGGASAACVNFGGLTGGDGEGDDASVEPARVDAGGGGDPGQPIQGAGSSVPDGATSTDAGVGPGTPPQDAGAPPVTVEAGGCGPASTVALQFGAPLASSPVFGGDSGVPFADTCPAGNVLVGFDLVADGSDPFALFRVRAICAPVTLAQCGGGALSMGPQTELAEHGDGTGPTGSLVCPAGSAVVGLSVTAQKFIHAVSVECAELVMAPVGSGLPITLGGTAVEGPFGGSGGSAVPPYRCPAPLVANALSGSVGGTDFVDSMILGCASPLPP